MGKRLERSAAAGQYELAPFQMCPAWKLEWRCEASEGVGHSDFKRCCKVQTAREELKEAASVSHEPTDENQV